MGMHPADNHYDNGGAEHDDDHHDGRSADIYILHSADGDEHVIAVDHYYGTDGRVEYHDVNCAVLYIDDGL